MRELDAQIARCIFQRESVALPYWVEDDYCNHQAYDPSEHHLLPPKFFEDLELFFDRGEDRSHSQRWESVPEYSNDGEDVKEVEAEIARRGLQYRYIEYLSVEVETEDETYAEHLYSLVTASPEARCRAALAAIAAAFLQVQGEVGAS